VVFSAVKETFFSAPSNLDVIYKAFVFYSVTYFQFGPREKGQNGSSGPAMKIKDCIIPFFSNLADELKKASQALILVYDINLVQVRISLDKFSVGLFYDIGNKGLGKALAEEGDGRSSHDHITDAPQPDKKKFFSCGEISV